MSTQIDQRIVEMRFDNKQFQKNVSETMSTLDSFKKQLKFEGATKGLKDINNAAKKVDMSGIGTSAEKVGLKFSALYTIADQALRNITNSAMHYGKKIVSALTIDPIKSGFSEYETQIGAIQTILSNTKSKGSTLEDVNGALDELNTYADKTIYNFTEMTRNIGTFTAAGVDLDTSVSAIKGIANLAAVSGSTSQQASTAMYQLSQALASGTVKLMDWNSVVNAGMGGQVFQDALKETARVHGIAIDDLIKKEGSFRESLSTGWLSSEILTETLSKFTGDLTEEQLKSMGYTKEQIKGILELGKDANDAATKVKTFSQLMDTLKESAQSGWSQSWEIIVGDFEEAKKLFTSVSDTISGMLGASADARNELLTNWKAMGGRTAVIDAIKYAFEGVVGVFKAVSEASKEIFPQMTAEKLVSISEKIRDVAKAFDAFFHIRDDKGAITGTTQNFENLKRTLKGVFAVVDIVRQIFVGLFKALGIVFGATDEVGGGLLAVTAVIGDWLVALRDAITYSNIFTNVFTGIAKLVKMAIKWFANLGRVVGDSFVFTAITEGLNYLVNLLIDVKDEGNRLADTGRTITEAWKDSGFYKFLMKAWNILKAIGSGIAKVFGGFFKSIGDAFGSGDFQTVFDVINGLLTGGLTIALASFVKNFSDVFSIFGTFKKSVKDVVDSVKDVVDGVGDTFKAFQQKLQADALLSIAKAIAILAAAIVVLTFIDQEELNKALAAILVLMTVMTVMMKILNSGPGAAPGAMGASLSKEGFKWTNTTNGLTSMALALLAAGVVLKLVAGLEWEEIAKGLVGALGALAILTLASIAISKFTTEGTHNKQGSKAILNMGLALLAITVPLKVLAGMKWQEFKQAMLGITIILGELAIIQTLFGVLGQNGGKNMLAGAASIMIISVSLMALIPMLLFLGYMPLRVLAQAVVFLGVILLELGVVQALYGHLGNNWQNLSAGATAIQLISKSLNTLIPMLTFLALLPLPNLVQAVAALGAILLELGIVQAIYGQLGGGAKKMMSGAAAIGIIIMSLNALIPFVLTIGTLPWKQAVQGIGAAIVVVGALATIMAIMRKVGKSANGMLIQAFAIKELAIALMLLAPAIYLLGTMKLEQVAIGIGALLGSLLGVVLIAALMGKIAPGMLSFALGIQSIGLGMLAAAAGALLFGVALGIIGAGILSLLGAITSLAGSLGMVAVGLTVLVAAVIEGVIRGIGAGIVALCQVLIEAMPLLADVVIEFVVMICDVLIGCIPKIVDTALILILAVLEGLAKYIPPIVAAIVELITGVINALAQELPDLIKAVVDLLFAFIEGCINALAGMDSSGLVDALKNMTILTVIIAELAAMAFLAPFAMTGAVAMGVVVAELALVLTALGKLAEIVDPDTIAAAGDLLQGVGKAVGQFVGGLVGGFAKGATDDLPEIGENLSEFADSIGGFLDIAPKLSSAMAGFAGASIANKIAAMFGDDKSSMEVFKTELPKLAEGLAGFNEKMNGVEIDSNKLQTAVDAVAILADVSNKLPKNGGLSGAIFGDIDMEGFASGLAALGTGLTAFQQSINAEGVSFDNIDPAINAAAKLVDLAEVVPKCGGLVAKLAGERSIDTFATDLGNLGTGISNFATNAGDITNDIEPAIKAAERLAELTNNIPNEGGIASWFAGNTAISKYKEELGDLGTGIKNFATNIGKTDPAVVEAAAKAGMELVNMTNAIPNQNGIMAWFTGESAVAKFGDELGKLGTGIAAFATNAGDITVEKITPAVDAAVKLAEMTEHIPRVGGISAWFTGNLTMETFGDYLGSLGTGIKDFATATTGITADGITPAADAAVKLAQMTEHIPREGGISEWFTGNLTLDTFASYLGNLGGGIAAFATAVSAEGVSIDAIGPATEAGIKLAEMTHSVPKEGGIASWFAGDIGYETFATALGKLGEGIAAFATAVNEVKGWGNVPSAAEAVKVLAEASKHMPAEGGFSKLLSGVKDVEKFGNNLSALGTGIAGFATEINEVKNWDNIPAAADATKILGETTSTIPKNTDKLVTFGDNVVKFGSKMKEFIADTKDIKTESVAGSKAVIELAEKAAAIDASNIKSVANEMDNLADAVKDMEKNIKSDMKKAGKNAVEGYIDGIESKLKDAKDAAKDLAEDCADKIADQEGDFKAAGKDLVKGFANGMSNNESIARQAAAAIGKAALAALKAAIDSHSPSKEAYKLGDFGGIGFVNGWLDNLSSASDAGHEIGDSAINGLKDAISKVQAYIDSDMDTKPTIRPVLDLTSVESGAGRIASILNGSSVGVNANIGAINSMMNSRVQNGTNADIIEAINELRKDLPNAGDTYQINGITYDDGSNISEAVKTLIRAAKIERRV